MSTVWRLSPTGGAPPDPGRLEAALRTHLAHGPLTCALARIGPEARAYVALDGCPGCADGRCAPGCRAGLLGRALAACGAGDLAAVPGGLAPRDYRAASIARPGPDAAPLHPRLLSEWPEVRLLVHWRRSRGVLGCAALLGVAGDGPEPAALLRGAGWRPAPLPHALLRAYLRVPQPAPPPLAGPWRRAPFLLAPAEAELPAPVRLAPTPEDAILGEWLAGIVALGRERAQRSAEPADDGRWPAGPGALAPAALGELMAQLVAEPSLRSERRGQSGLTKGRLVALRHRLVDDDTARALMVWLDRAGALLPPEHGQSPWRAPRPFATPDLDDLSRRLRATPLPAPEDVRAAYEGGEPWTR